MTATNHALTGAMIASVVSQPLLVIPLAFCSHFLCDSLPHFGVDLKFGSRTMYHWLIIDGLAMGIIGLGLLWYGVTSPLLLAVAAFAAMSPDLAWLYYGVKSVLSKVEAYDVVSRFHSKIQWYQKPSGIIIEFVWAFVMITIIYTLQS